MKKTFWTMWLLVAAGVGFVACRGGDAEGFETADLPADSLTVEGFSGYTSWMRQGDKVVVYTLPGDTNFSVYRLPEFEPLYDFAVEPRKPGSFFYAAGLFPDGVQEVATSVYRQTGKAVCRARLAAERERDHLALEVTLQQPKVDYFDAMVERNLLLSLRETAKLLKVREKAFIRWLLENRYLFRGKSGKLLPYATRPHNDCFEVKEWFDRETGKGGVQTLVTPKGRETFRLLLDGKPESGLWHFPMFPTQLPPEMTEEEARQAEEFYLSGKFRSHHV